MWRQAGCHEPLPPSRVEAPHDHATDEDHSRPLGARQDWSRYPRQARPHHRVLRPCARARGATFGLHVRHATSIDRADRNSRVYLSDRRNRKFRSQTHDASPSAEASLSVLKPRAAHGRVIFAPRLGRGGGCIGLPAPSSHQISSQQGRHDPQTTGGVNGTSRDPAYDGCRADRQADLFGMAGNVMAGHLCESGDCVLNFACHVANRFIRDENSLSVSPPRISRVALSMASRTSGLSFSLSMNSRASPCKNSGSSGSRHLAG